MRTARFDYVPHLGRLAGAAKALSRNVNMAEAEGDADRNVGRPKVLDNEGNVFEMLTLGFSVEQISKMLKISRPTGS